MNYIHSTLDALRERYAPVSHTSTFRSTGQITPEEFVLAGDFLVYKFPSWAWAPASSAAKRVAYLPEDKQYLVTRGVPCRRRLENFESAAGLEEKNVEGEDGEEGWLRTGGGEKDLRRDEREKEREVRTLDGSGNVGEEPEQEDDEIPDMEEDDDDQDAIIREPKDTSDKGTLRTYTLYITYSTYYRTPRMYLSGYVSASEPLSPPAMMEDIAGDYKDKTVTLEDFPFFDNSQAIKMASIHPCKHASVMNVLLNKADAALRLRREKGKSGKGVGMEGLVDEMDGMAIKNTPAFKAGVAAAGGNGGDEWEVLQHDGEGTDDSAIRVDQYLIVFLKFMASVTPTIEHDFTMSV